MKQDTKPKEQQKQVQKPVKQEQKRKYAPPQYRKDDWIYCMAYLKGQEGKFYVCRGIIDEVPQPDQRRLYKVKIVAVADRAIGSNATPEQASLLGRVITKRENEINWDIPEFMQPKQWIVADAEVEAKG